MRRGWLVMMMAFGMLSAGCIFGSRPILPLDDYDAGGGGGRTNDNGAFTGSPDGGTAPGLADASGGEVTVPGVLDSDQCIPRDGAGRTDGGDAGYVLRDGGAPCDPAINMRDAGASDADVLDAGADDGAAVDASQVDASQVDDGADDSASGARFDRAEGAEGAGGAP